MERKDLRDAGNGEDGEKAMALPVCPAKQSCRNRAVAACFPMSSKLPDRGYQVNNNNNAHSARYDRCAR